MPRKQSIELNILLSAPYDDCRPNIGKTTIWSNPADHHTFHDVEFANNHLMNEFMRLWKKDNSLGSEALKWQDLDPVAIRISNKADLNKDIIHEISLW